MTEPKTNFYQQTEEIKNHYEKLADKYNSFWGDSPELIDFYSQKIVEYLELKPTDNFVDLGCGTGIYTKKIRDLAQLINPVICVDISAKMLENIPDNKKFKTILMDAVEFSAQPGRYDKILMQNMTHHILDKEKLIRNFAQKLNLDGKILIIGLPYRLDYPLFEKALKKFQNLYYKGEQSIDFFLNLDFEVKLNYIKFPVSVEKSKYLKMVKHRFISTLSSFSDPEIEEGLKELEGKYQKKLVLNFNEIFLFILILRKN